MIKTASNIDDDSSFQITFPFVFAVDVHLPFAVIVIKMSFSAAVCADVAGRPPEETFENDSDSLILRRLSVPVVNDLNCKHVVLVYG